MLLGHFKQNCTTLEVASDFFRDLWLHRIGVEAMSLFGPGWVVWVASSTRVSDKEKVDLCSFIQVQGASLWVWGRKRKQINLFLLPESTRKKREPQFWRPGPNLGKKVLPEKENYKFKGWDTSQGDRQHITPFLSLQWTQSWKQWGHKMFHVDDHLRNSGNALAVWCFGVGTFTAGGLGSIPGWGTEILQANSEHRPPATSSHSLCCTPGAPGSSSV